MPNRFVRPTAAVVALGFVLAGCAADPSVAPSPQPGSGPSRLAAALPSVRISEIHYDNGSTDLNERIELSGPAGTTLAGWRLVLYNGSPTQRSAYGTTNLTGTFANSCDGRGVLVFSYPSNGIQNGGTGPAGEPDAIALVDANGTVVEFLSYEGSFTAVAPASPSNPAGGLTSTDIGVYEDGTQSADWSVQRTGAGLNTWNPPAANSFGACNDNGPTNTVTVQVTAATTAFAVGQGTTVTAAVTRNGAAVTPSAVTWTASGAGAVSLADASANPVTATGVTAGAVTLTATVTVDGAPYEGAVALTVTAPPTTSTTRISEFHYDNEGTDQGEAIEVEGDAGQSLAGWSLVLYNRSPGSTSAQVYHTIALAGTFANQCSGRGTLAFPVPANPGLQNGANDGIALVNAGGQVVELLSYEGSFTATEGPAAGQTATDVGVEEGGSTQSNQSLQRAANGTWYGPATETFGLCNAASAPAVVIEGYSFRGNDPIPVGFGELYRFKDAASGAFVRAGVTWTTADPAIATVDALGNVTARAAGETFLTATETATGRTASQRVRVVQFAPVDESVYADELQFGVPTDANPGDDLVVNRATFAASWSAARGQPTWVAYNLEQTHRTGAVDRCDCFAPDPLLPAGTPAIYSSDYDGSGYSRGHMTMSADRTRGALDNAQTFYFSNIIPQTSANNGGPWLQLENFLGAQAASGTKEIFVFAGGAAYSGTLNDAGRVAIPTRTWKVAVILDRNEGIGDVLSPADVEIIAVDMPNTTTVSGGWEQFRTSVDAIEALTGYDFLSALPDGIEQIVEARRGGVAQQLMELQPGTISVSTTTTVTTVLLSTVTFDAAAVDPATLRLVVNSGAEVAPIMRGTAVNSSVRDMNGDGRPDRLIGFGMSALRAAGFSPSAAGLLLRPAGASPVWEAFDVTPPSVVP